jgi:hypothetical protein
MHLASDGFSPARGAVTSLRAGPEERYMLLTSVPLLDDILQQHLKAMGKDMAGYRKPMKSWTSDTSTAAPSGPARKRP